MELYSFLIGLTISSIWGFIGYKIAKKKNLNPKLWACLLVLFGLLSFIFLIFKKPKQEKELDKEDKAKLKPLATIIQSNWYFLNNKNETNGPIKFEELIEEFNLGNITKKSLVWNPTYSDWKKLEDESTIISKLNKRS